jgi:Mannosyltransferase (PIG-V)
VLEPAVVAIVERRRSAIAWIAERREILGWWAGSRAVVVATGLALHWLRAPRGYFGPHILRHALGPLESWDGIWYRHVAQHGYLFVPGHQSDPAFFPLYPLLLKFAGATGISTGAAGVILSNLLFLAALMAFDAFGAELFTPTLARRATLLLAVFPTSYVCSMVYPESLVLLAFALAGFFALRGRWLSCAAVAAVAALARPEGALLVFPILGCLIARHRQLEPNEKGRAVAAVLAAPAAAISFPLYLGWALHDPLAWSKAQLAWGRSFRLDGVLLAIRRVAEDASRTGWTVRDVAFCVLTLLLLVAARRAGAPRGWILLGALIVLLPLGSGAFTSDARFGLLALPAYWGLAWLARTPLRFALVAAVSTVLLVAATFTLPLVFP